MLEIPKPEMVEDNYNRRALIASSEAVTAALKYGPTGELYYAGSLLYYGMQGKMLLEMANSESFGFGLSTIELVTSLAKPMKHSLKRMKHNTEIPDLKNMDISTKDLVSNVLPSLFYLSRNHVFGLRNDGQKVSDIIDSHDTCARHVMETIMPCIGPAAWLYSIKLPGVHNKPEWTKWYLQRVLKMQGWDLISSQTESETLPKMQTEMEEKEDEEGVYVHVEKIWTLPAFALVTRSDDAGKGNARKREAMLVVRGTSNMLDWTINLNSLPENVTYFKGAEGEGDIVEGKVHAGMYRGARGILDHAHMAEAIDKLINDGYSIKVVGHSLGAGTASIIALLLKERYVRSLLEYVNT